MVYRPTFVSSIPRVLALLLGLSALQLAAATTAPIGYTEHRIAGTGGQIDRTRTYLAVPMLGRAVETGTIARIDGATLHLQLSGPSEKSHQARPLPRSTYAGTHYLQIVKGPRTGYHADLAGGDAGSLQTTHDLSALLQPGDAYQVRPYTTLTALLGPNNRYARLHAAAGFAQADQIYIPDPGSGQLAAYYYRQQGTAAPVLAHRDGRPDQTDPILYPGSGFMISRIAEADTTLGSLQTHAASSPSKPASTSSPPPFPSIPPWPNSSAPMPVTPPKKMLSSSPANSADKTNTGSRPTKTASGGSPTEKPRPPTRPLSPPTPSSSSTVRAKTSTSGSNDPSSFDRPNSDCLIESPLTAHRSPTTDHRRHIDL